MQRRIFILLLAAAIAGGISCRHPGRPVVKEATAKLQTVFPAEYVLVDTAKKELTVIKNDNPIITFDHVAFGSAGTGIKHRRGDNITPLGEFKIVSRNPTSKFHLFFALNYPSMEYAERALNEKVINEKQFARIKDAHDRDQAPPQDTPLGGLVGIHGVGRGSLKIHRAFNWTDGCIALDNKQIEQLDHLVHIGMPVIVR